MIVGGYLLGSKVDLISNSNIYASQQMRLKYAQQPAALSSQGSQLATAEVDETCDGKFNMDQALKNFGKGLVSPITSMFSSKKSFLVGATTILGSVALVIATGGAAAPLLVAAGVGLGTLQAGKAVYNIASAKNGDDVEKAFYDIGGATGAIGLSLLGAKASLKQAGVVTENLDTFSATAKCFKDSKSFLMESSDAFTTGHFKANITNAVKPYLYPRSLRTISKQFANDGKSTFAQDFEEVKSVIPEDIRADLKGRSKSRRSIFDKLVDRCTFNSRIRKINDCTTLTSAEKEAQISCLKAQREKFKADKIGFAKNMIDDLEGTRLVVKDPVPENINKIVNSLADAIKKDKIVIAEIKNYSGKNIENGHYFSKEQIKILQDATKLKGREIKLTNGGLNTKDSGYCALQVKIKHKSGAWGELQIRGQHVDEVASWEHIIYDLKKDKDLTMGSNEMGKLLQPLKVAIKKLNPTQYKEYQTYVAKLFKHARDKERGHVYAEPTLPEGFDPILNAKSLKEIHQQTEIIQAKHQKHFSTIPQFTVAYGATPKAKSN